VTTPRSRTAGGRAPIDAAPRTSDNLLREYRQVRAFFQTLCEPLAKEDYVVQSMPDASPVKWHLAHTTWFFETLVLAEFIDGYERPQPQFNYLFNSYYNTVGPQFNRPRRGLISRPTVDEVFAYREHVDNEMKRLLTSVDDEQFRAMAPIVTIGLNHEQQHQELMLTDLKHMLAQNPLEPVYRAQRDEPDRVTIPEQEWHAFDAGEHEIGHDERESKEDFAYDNESPRHTAYLQPFEIASRLVTNREFIEFIDAGGYEQHEHWLSDGWATVQAEEWSAPLYWFRRDGEWWNFTLSGARPVDPDEPVCHVSLFEADAYARWRGVRLPTEAEWEVASTTVPIEGNFVEARRHHPRPLDASAEPPGSLMQMFGDVWEWTGSQYRPYPGYQPPPGAVGEYNGKFMCNQFVLRGGSCATSWSHIRRTYRNFFPPEARWQFAGVRLARDA